MIIINAPKSTDNEIVYNFQYRSKTYEFYIRYNTLCSSFNLDIDWIVAILSIVSMCEGIPIISECPIDNRLYENILGLSLGNYKDVHPQLFNYPVDLQLPVKRKSGVVCKKSITSLTLGVDSFYTILKYKSDISTFGYIECIDGSTYVPGFIDNLTYVSNYYHKPLIQIQTNIREVLAKCFPINYSLLTRSMMVIACYYPLGFNKVYYSGAGLDPPNYSFPYLTGENPKLLLNSSEVEVIYTDCLRIKKLLFIYEQYPKWLKILRVCNCAIKNIPTMITDKYGNYFTSKYNCSSCGKCLTTYLYCQLLGISDYLLSFKKCEINLDLKRQPDTLAEKTFLAEISATIDLRSKFDHCFQFISHLKKVNGIFNNDDTFQFKQK